MAGLGDALHFRDDDQRSALGAELRDLTDQLETEHETYFRDIDVWRDWRDAIPDVKERVFPYRRASNIVIPLIAIQSDAMTARILLQTFSSNKLWYGTTENEAWKPTRLDNTFRFLNYCRRKRDPGFYEACESGIDEQQVVGSAIYQQLWCSDSRYVMPRGARKPTLVNMGTGPRLFHHRREQVLYPREGPIEEAPVVVVQKPMTWGRLQQLVTADERLAAERGEKPRWDRDAVERIRGQSGFSGITDELRRGARRRAGLAEETDRRFEPYDIREVWIDFPFLSELSDQSSYDGITQIGSQSVDHFTVPILCYIHAPSGTLLMASYSEYLLTRLPFYEMHRKRVTSRGDQNRGLAKDMEMLQRAMSTMFNQAIDAINVGNSLKLITTDGKLAAREWSPNRPLLVSNINETKELTGFKVIIPEMQMVAALQSMSERVGGGTDPSMGQESKMGGHPSPATNFVGMLQQTQMLSTRSIKSVSNALARVGEDRALLYQQFETNEGHWIEAVFGDTDAADITAFLESEEPFAGQVHIEVHSLSEMHNPDAELRKAVALDQMVTNYHVRLNSFLQLMNPASGATPEMIANAKQAVESLGKTMTAALEAGDVDEVEDFVFKLQENQRGNLALLQQLPGLLGAGASGPGAPAVPAGASGEGDLSGPPMGPLRPPPARSARLAAGGGGSGFRG